jgi:hypothetical protein
VKRRAAPSRSAASGAAGPLRREGVAGAAAARNADGVAGRRVGGLPLAAMRLSPHLAAELARYRDLLDAEVKRRARRGGLDWSC